jgi:hypothetical protein
MHNGLLPCTTSVPSALASHQKRIGFCAIAVRASGLRTEMVLQGRHPLKTPRFGKPYATRGFKALESGL